MYSKAWVQDFPSANARLFVSLHLAIIWAIAGIAGVMIGRLNNTNDGAYFKIGIIISVWLGIDMSHFAFKRFSDERYARAKAAATTPPVVEAGPGSTTVLAGPSVAVQQPAPVAQQPLATRESEKGDGK